MQMALHVVQKFLKFVKPTSSRKMRIKKRAIVLRIIHFVVNSRGRSGRPRA